MRFHALLLLSFALLRRAFRKKWERANHKKLNKKKKNTEKNLLLSLSTLACVYS